MGEVKIVKNILTKNDCYKSGRTITPDCMQLHTIGTGQNTAKSLADYWNQSGIQACVHYCIDAEQENLVLQFLPDNIRSWADGGYGNGHAITVELMESDYMKYSGNGASYTITNEQKFKADVTRAYNTAVKFFAMKCKEYGWNPQEKMSNGLYRIFSHDEGRRAGVSTAHVDPTHIWDRYGWTMNQFRADVAAQMGIITSVPKDEKYYRVRISWDQPNTQFGAYLILDNAIANCPSGYKVFDNDGKIVYEVKQEELISDASGIPKSKEDYIAKVSAICMNLYKETHILPSVVISQCCLETGFGLANDCKELVKRNNLLGMKTNLINNTWADYTVWNGQSFTKRTPEYYGGELHYIDDSFRVYKNYENCIRDYEMFLLNVKNNNGYKYREIAGKTNPQEVITIISKNGYATDPNYITSVMRLINEYDFTKYDKQVVENKADVSKPTEKSQSDDKPVNPTHYIVQAGAFLVKSNAEKMKKQLANMKITSEVKKRGLMYVVQLGDYLFKDNAVAFSKYVKDEYNVSTIIKEIKD